MGWRMHEKPKTVLAGKGLVAEFAAMEPAPYDRPLSERRMMVYERILRAGDFRPVTWASALCAETTCTYRVNGKHTATLLSRMDPLPDFYVTVERWYCDTLNDVGNLYNTFDSALSSRTSRDINLSFAATVPTLRDVPQKLIHLTVSAAAALKWDENELKRVPPAERAEELLENQEFVPWLGRVLGGTGFRLNSPAKPLMRAPVVAAMLATYRKAPRVAEQFWVGVRDESAPNRDDATRVLARFLIRSALAGGQGRATDKKLVGFREMYVKCLHAWNSWRAGEELDRLNYFASSPVPAVSK